MKYTFEVQKGEKYDVIVCGGGTAGVMAAVAAARDGAKTLLLERTFTVGGMLTLGEAGITKFTEHCRDVDMYKKEVLDVLATNPRKVQVAGGLAHDYVIRMIRKGGALGTSGEAGSYVFTDRYCAQLTLIEMLNEVGVQVLYDTRVCHAVMDGDTIRGVVVVNKEGFTEYDADCVIDTTGDADVAAYAGVAYHKGASEADVAECAQVALGQLHSVGTMYRVTGVDFARLFDYLEQHPERFIQHEFGVMDLKNARSSYENDEMCVFRIWMDGEEEGDRFPVQIYNLPDKKEAILLGRGCGADADGLNAKSISDGQHKLLFGACGLTEKMRVFPGFEHARVCYIPDVGVRETRHIVGKYVLTAKDVFTSRDFEDSIACGGHPIDIKPMPPELEHMEMNHWRFHIPYRVMLPEKVKNLLVAGRCFSGTRIASGAVRPTVQCMALGEAAGTAAAMAVKANCAPDEIDVQALREKLVDYGAVI